MDRREQLLKAADAATESPVGFAGLAGQVRRLDRRRRARRVGVCIAGVLAIAVMLSRWNGNRQHRTATITAPFDAEAIRAELFEIRAEADSRIAGVERYLERRNRRRTSQPPPAADDPIRREQDRAALLLILRADRIYHELGRRESAVAGYRRVLELFPTTPAAQVARERLAMIEG